jgi:pyridoxine 5'-phosphate synthase PdxJ
MEIRIEIFTGTYRNIGEAIFSTPEEVETYMNEIKKLDSKATYLVMEVKQ